MSTAPHLPSEEECRKVAGRALTAGFLEMLTLDPHDAAVAAYIPNVTRSVEELEATIRELHAAAAARASQRAA